MSAHRPPIDLGPLAVVLGFIGLLLFFLPILGIPISAFGLLCGLVGSVIARAPGGVRLRWSLLGCAVAGLALAINVAITYAPAGYTPAPGVTPPWQGVPDRPYVPPPAPPRELTD